MLQYNFIKLLSCFLCVLNMFDAKMTKLKKNDLQLIAEFLHRMVLKLYTCVAKFKISSDVLGTCIQTYFSLKYQNVKQQKYRTPMKIKICRSLIKTYLL